MEATLPGTVTRGGPATTARCVPEAPSSRSGPNTSATRGTKSQPSLLADPDQQTDQRAGRQMSLSHAKGLPPDQHRVLADGTTG